MNKFLITGECVDGETKGMKLEKVSNKSVEIGSTLILQFGAVVKVISCEPVVIKSRNNWN